MSRIVIYTTDTAELRQRPTGCTELSQAPASGAGYRPQRAIMSLPDWAGILSSPDQPAAPDHSRNSRISGVLEDAQAAAAVREYLDPSHSIPRAAAAGAQSALFCSGTCRPPAGTTHKTSEFFASPCGFQISNVQTKQRRAQIMLTKEQ